MEKIEIKPKGTTIAKAVEYDKYFSNFLVKTAFACLWILGLSAFVLIVLDNFFGIGQDKSVIGLSYVVFGIFLAYLPNRYYQLDKVKHPRAFELSKIAEKINPPAGGGKKENLFQVFSFELAKATKKLFESENKILTKELALDVLSSNDMNFILMRLGISKKELNNSLINYQGSDRIEAIFLRALKIAIFEHHDQIEIGDVFVSLCENDQFFTDLIQNLKLEITDVANIVYWQTKIMREVSEHKKFFSPEKFRLTGGIGKDWAYGWTPFLKQFSTDLTKTIQARGLDVEIIGHENEITQISEALIRQNGGNVIIVGDAGVGKRTAVLGFIKKVLEGKTNSALDFQHVIQIDIDYLLGGIKSPGELTERLSGVFSEAASAGNIIIYFENFQNLLSSGDAGKVDATEVLLSFLESPEMHIIGTCDVGNYNRYIATNSSLVQRFTRITVEEPTNEEMIRILEDTVPIMEYKTHSIISYEAIKETVLAADKYILNLPNPEKSINLLDGATTKASSQRGKTIILPKDISEYVTEKFNVPALEVEEGEKQKLLKLEEFLHQSVVGQAEAIAAISNALRRARSGVTNSKKPIGSFLFLGPTGVGKTETAKALARSYFGAEDRMIRFDMSEFQNKEDIYRLIGSNLGGESEIGSLTTAVRERPFSLLLFDEIEKAHRDILDLFLQMLDEGIITDGEGRKVSFMNTIIIATSNAGANLIRESINNGEQYENMKKTLLDYLQKEDIYRPEFLNRFNGVIAFSPLSQTEINQVAVLMIEKLKETIQKNKGVTLEVAPEAVSKLAKLGFDPVMGARPMERVIQEKLENLLATKILSGELKKGDTITIGLNDLN